MAETKHTPTMTDVQLLPHGDWRRFIAENTEAAEHVLPEVDRWAESYDQAMAAHDGLVEACEWLAAAYDEEGCNTDHPGYIEAVAAIAKAKGTE